MVLKWCTKLEVVEKRCPIVFSCDQAALWMVQSVCPSVRLSLSLFVRHTFLAATKQLYEWYFLSICLSVRLSHLFSCDQAALWMVYSVCLSVTPFYPSALRAGGVLSSRFGRAGGWAGGWAGGRAGGCQTCGSHISVTAWQIFSIQSSVELSRPVVVHCHGHLPICPIWACPWAKNLSNLPQIGSRLCGTRISETAGWIYSISSFMDLSGPVVVHRHSFLPICPIWACPWVKNLSNQAALGPHFAEPISLKQCISQPPARPPNRRADLQIGG